MAVLVKRARGQVQRSQEDRLKAVFAGDLPCDVPDGAPEIGLKLAQRLVGDLPSSGTVNIALDSYGVG